MQERWFGSTGTKVPAIALEGDAAVPLEGALVVDSIADLEQLQAAHSEGRPVVVRAADPESVHAALARPEVSCVLVPAGRSDLLELDLRRMTYG